MPKQKQIKDKVLTIRLNERTCQILEELKEETGSYSLSDTIRQAIYSFYGKFHKDYAPKSSIGASTRIEKFKPTQEEKELEHKYNICSELGGNVVDKNGAKSCEYKVYEMVNPALVEIYETTLPFSILTKDVLKSQYSPSKDVCEKILNLK